MMTEVTCPEGVLRETFDERVPAFIAGIGDQQLIGLGAQRRLSRIERRVEIADSPQPLDRPFAKQIAALHHFLNQLFKANALPLPAAACPTRFIGSSTR
jgi:hypothetical protein